jgi:hypothetical protein
MSLLLLFGGAGVDSGSSVTTLERVHDGLGPLIIRKLGDVGGPRSDRVEDELDSIISFINDLVDGTGVIANVPRCIHRDTDAIGNVGAGLDSLHTFDLPAGSLATDGDYLRVRYAGTFATNDNDKRIQISVDGQAVRNTTALDFDLGEWVEDITYIRLTSTTIRATLSEKLGFLNLLGGAAGGSGFHAGISIDITVSNLDSNDVTLLVEAESSGAASDDIVQNLSIIELTQQ